MKKLLKVKYSFIIVLLILGLSTVLPIQASVLAPKTDIKTFVPDEDENFNRIFREGRDLIDQEEWAKAIEKFKELVCDCPEKKSVDAAYYWLAFCYKKQKMYKEADAAIASLLQIFPKSSWADDAKVMKYQIAGLAISPAQVKTVRGTVSSYPTQVRSVPLASTVIIGIQAPFDRQDEIKLAAFQSLFVSDQKKAIETVGSLLSVDSKASETLKREVLRSLRTPLNFRLTATQNVPAGVKNTPFYTISSSISQFEPQNLNLLKETLFNGFEAEKNIEVKEGIIYTIADLNDEQSAKYLVQRYDTENDKKLKKTLIGSFSQTMFTFVSRNDVTTAKVNNNVVVESVQPVNLKRSSVKTIYLEKLGEIVKTENDNELRLLAFSNLQGFANWQPQGEVLDIIIKLYDEDLDEKLKSNIISSLGRLSQKKALEKLISIAKTDKSDTLKLQAIFVLRGNKSPEAIKFLEELIM